MGVVVDLDRYRAAKVTARVESDLERSKAAHPAGKAFDPVRKALGRKRIIRGPWRP